MINLGGGYALKKVGTAMYVHKTALKQLYDKLDVSGISKVEKAMKIADNRGFGYQVVKFDNGKVSLIQSCDFDTANEPSVGESLCINDDGQIKMIKPSDKIYHRKYIFVNADYLGFDVEEAKRRAELWETSIPDIKAHLSRIGQRAYWYDLLDKYGIAH